jgi:hypothetical protein
MKKITMTLLLVIIISASAYAARPTGWALGIVGQYNLAWDGFEGAPGAALSLKISRIPILWGINLDLPRNGFGVSLTGDRYLIERGRIFGWCMGIGAYAGVLSYSDTLTEWTSIRAGARIPIGLYIFPVSFLELFANLAPNLGVGLYFGDYPERFEFPEGGLGLDIGLRFWLR